MDALDALWTQSKPAVVAHWARCEQGGLPHTAADRDQVITAFETYITTLQGLPNGHGDQPGLGAIQEFLTMGSLSFCLV